jgi:hypothetical protein
MKTIKSQESYSSEKLHKLLPIAWAILIYLVLVLIALILTSIIPALQRYFLGMVISASIVFIFMKKFDPFFEKVGNFIKGKRGEDKVAVMLKENLDDSYTYIENYMIPNARIGDIDGLLIGPKGVIILEVKNYQGVFRISGPDLYRRNRGDNYTLYKRSPFAQTIRQKNYLSKHFKNNGLIDMPIKMIVVFPEAKISSISGETGVFITENDKLINRIFQLSQAPNWDSELENRIVNCLGVNLSII